MQKTFTYVLILSEYLLYCILIPTDYLLMYEYPVNIGSAVCEYLLIIYQSMNTHWISALLCVNTYWLFTHVWIPSEYRLCCVWIPAGYLFMYEYSVNICSAVCEYLLIIYKSMKTQWTSALLCANTCWLFIKLWILVEYLLCSVWIRADYSLMYEYSVNICSAVFEYLLIIHSCMNTQ
jgi:hypothetical protein